MVHRRLLPFVALLAACQSRPAVAPSSSGASGPAAARSSTGASGPVAARSSTGTSGPVTLRAMATAAPAVPAAPITFRFANRAGAPRYYGYVRHWTEALTVERREGTAWQGVPYVEPPCVEWCPADGTLPACRFCSPGIPIPSHRKLTTLDHVWNGTVHESQTLAGARCACVRRRPAAAGRYRATFCVYAEAACDDTPCQGRGGHMRGPVKGQPACTTVEFDVDGRAREVPVVVR